MAKRIKRIKECVSVEKILIQGKKRKKKIYEEFIYFDNRGPFDEKFNWTKWRRDHPGRQLTLWDVWKGYE